jgi:hypothetical protein
MCSCKKRRNRYKVVLENARQNSAGIFFIFSRFSKPTENFKEKHFSMIVFSAFQRIL